MTHDLIKLVEAPFAERRSMFPNFLSGDTINVHVKIKEGNKERIQQFQGIVLQRRNCNTNGETFTVIKTVSDVNIERIFPILSPCIEKIEVIRRGMVRRARLFYFKNKIGKEARIKERKFKLEKGEGK